MSEASKISISLKGEVTIIYLRCDLTTETRGEFEDVFNQVRAGGAKKILLHFDKDSYINSGGIAPLVSIASKSKDEGLVIRITGLSKHFHKIFNLVGLSKYTSIYPSEETALESFNSVSR